MLENITCSCGQQLDVSDFSAGDQVKCPKCGKIHTVGGQNPPVADPIATAIALPDEDEEEQPKPQARQTVGNDFAARRKRSQKRAAAQQSMALQRVLVWPALVFALIAIGIGVLGIYLRTIPPKIERVTSEGVERLYVQAPVAGEAGKFERVEVQPDIYPGDQVRPLGSYQPGESPFMLNGYPLDWGQYGNDDQGQLVLGAAIKVDGELTMIPVVRRGLWFYRYDVEEKKLGERLDDMPLIAAQRNGEYVPVVFHDQDFYLRAANGSRGARADGVAWYRIDENGVQVQQMSAGEFREQLFMNMRPHQVAGVFAIAGFSIGLVLLALGGMMLHNAFLSPAAKDQAAQRQAFLQGQKEKSPSASAKQ